MAAKQVKMSRSVWLAMLATMIFAKQDGNTANALRGGDRAQMHVGRLLDHEEHHHDSTCYGGFPGIQTGEACCPLECGQCGGDGCSEVDGFDDGECCEDTYYHNFPPCSRSGEAPCRNDLGFESTETEESGSTAGGYSYIGCYADDMDDRILSSFWKNNQMTAEMCQSSCEGDEFFGTQNGNECWCGIFGTDPYKHGLSDNCNKYCWGDSSQTCGGENTMDLYQFDE